MNVPAGPGIKKIRGFPFFGQIEKEMMLVESEIHRAVTVDNPLAGEIGTHLLRGGGKRIRPALVLLSGRFGDQGNEDALILIGAMVEMIHMATLVHDDVVDDSIIRRGLPTINVRWNEQISVLMGDYLYARALSMLASHGDPEIVGIMADVVSVMCAGEIRQLIRAANREPDEETYFDQIKKKTAYFIAECCRLGGMVGGASPDHVQILREYGFEIGMGFQIIDDLLDITASVEELGKPIGSDLRAGVITLPVVYALEHSPRRDRIRNLIFRPGLGEEDILALRELLRQCGAFEYTGRMAEDFISRAKARLHLLPQNPARDGLENLADFILSRNF